MKKIILAATILLLLLLLPLLYYQMKTGKIYHRTLESFLFEQNDYIAEQQLIISGFSFDYEEYGWFNFTKNDTFKIETIEIPVIINYTFVNGDADTGAPNRFLFDSMPYVTLPYIRSITYQAKFDSILINSLNNKLVVDIPMDYSVYESDTTFYSAIWVNTDSARFYHLQMDQREGHHNSSILWVDLHQSAFYRLLNLYIKSSLKVIPDFLKPEWFKTTMRNI